MTQDEVAEVLNGILSIILMWMLVFLIIHLKRIYDELRLRYSGPGGAMRAVCALYRDNKPEIALGTIVGFLTIRTFMIWYIRFSDNNGYNSLLGYGSPLVILSTAGLIVGVSCWVRVISPFDGMTDAWLWLTMTSSALLFGFGMSYIF